VLERLVTNLCHNTNQLCQSAPTDLFYYWRL
jgi:hypothetical protein